METIKIESIKDAPFIITKIASDGGINIKVSNKPQAIQLAAAITDHFSEWLPIKDAPTDEEVWIKNVQGDTWVGKIYAEQRACRHKVCEAVKLSIRYR